MLDQELGTCRSVTFAASYVTALSQRAISSKTYLEEIQMVDETKGSLSGLSEDEAMEFHGVFMTSMMGFLAVAAVAHVLAWMWRPWGVAW
ncbi:light-harvesting antenna LH1, beta subunit [Ectothiorhodospira shaposhnikovii]|uniref:light-harvesting antenna LH1, beta subunit n=1 Tax=Ectothiorhodospira shaposhnikovii TaxID=1054 RepID=UPI0030B84FF6